MCIYSVTTDWNKNLQNVIFYFSKNICRFSLYNVNWYLNALTMITAYVLILICIVTWLPSTKSQNAENSVVLLVDNKPNQIRQQWCVTTSDQPLTWIYTPEHHQYTSGMSIQLSNSLNIKICLYNTQNNLLIFEKIRGFYNFLLLSLILILFLLPFFLPVILFLLLLLLLFFI